MVFVKTVGQIVNTAFEDVFNDVTEKSLFSFVLIGRQTYCITLYTLIGSILRKISKLPSDGQKTKKVGYQWPY